MSTPSRFRHAESAGAYHLPTTRPMKLTPAQLPLTLTADVLRLPYPLATRVVLAEIISLHACNAGLCDASDAHFAARLSINKDTVSVAVKLLEAEGLVVKVTTRTPSGLYRTLAPVPSAITEKAATNPYPENPGTRKKPDAYPENPAWGTRKFRGRVPGNSGSNTSSLNSSLEHSSKPSSAAHGVAAESEVELPAVLPRQPRSPSEELAPEDPAASASQTGGRRAKAGEEPPGFAAFYAAYPRREKRKEALGAFRKLHPDDQAQAAGRAAAWFAARPDLSQPDRQKYIPLAASWLNAERWTDEASPTPPNDSATPHANRSTFSTNQHRPVSGAKPTGAGGEFARALAERRAGLTGAGAGHYGPAAGLDAG